MLPDLDARVTALEALLAGSLRRLEAAIPPNLPERLGILEEHRALALGRLEALENLVRYQAASVVETAEIRRRLALVEKKEEGSDPR